MAKHPAVGDQAPDFELEGTHGPFKLSDRRGEKVMLLFYPGDETSVCTKQFCAYRDNAQAFGALGVTAVGISGKNVDSKRKFAAHNDLTVPLLADQDFSVAKAYDTYSGLVKSTKRSVIIIDEQGDVVHRHDHALGLDFQTVADLKKALDGLPAMAQDAQAKNGAR
jgi:peroxiredoxin Q/BCP